MQTQPEIGQFDAANWLAQWTAAGGGWTNRSLLIPRGSHPRLRRMIVDLSCDQILAIADHLGVSPRTTERNDHDR